MSFRDILKKKPLGVNNYLRVIILIKLINTQFDNYVIRVDIKKKAFGKV